MTYLKYIMVGLDSVESIYKTDSYWLAADVPFNFRPIGIAQTYLKYIMVGLGSVERQVLMWVAFL